MIDCGLLGDCTPGRQDSGSDLQLLLLLNVLLVLLGSIFKKEFVDPIEGDRTNLWLDIYAVRPFPLNAKPEPNVVIQGDRSNMCLNIYPVLPLPLDCHAEA